MKNIIFVFSLLLTNSISLSAQETKKSDAILGIWLSENKDGKVEIYQQGNKYFGKLIWGKDMFESDGVTSKKDTKNTDANLKNRNLKDLVILTNFVFEDGVWSGGKIYDPQVGKLYSCSMKLENNVLNIRGYVGISLFGRTSEWTRIK